MMHDPVFVGSAPCHGPHQKVPGGEFHAIAQIVSLLTLAPRNIFVTDFLVALQSIARGPSASHCVLAEVWEKFWLDVASSDCGWYFLLAKVAHRH